MYLSYVLCVYTIEKHIHTLHFTITMNKLFAIITLVLFGAFAAFGNTNPNNDDETIVKVETTEETVLIEALREADFLTTRPIAIYSENGKRIFKSKARKFEQITEINMANVKEGNYIIKIKFEDKVVDIPFEKKA